jgi:DNA ligase-1
MSRLLRCLILGCWVALQPMVVPAAAPDILLANVYRDGIDVGAYLVSEKLDGVRAIWDGEQLRFRSGLPVAAPEWFMAALPKVPLDGELWAGRGTFERLSGIVRKAVPVDEEWRQVRYMIFELPGAPGDFATRARQIETVVQSAQLPWLQAIEQRPAVDRRQVAKMLAEVLKAGGEGLMLHRADAPYETGRSDTLLKVKPWLDAEGVVVAHLPGKGRHAGRLGALRLRLPDGRSVAIGTGFTDAQRDDPPPLGSVVTYRYRELTASGLPRFASFLRVRTD